MKKEYDLSRMKRRKNPFASHLKKQVTIRLGVDVIDYFKALADENRHVVPEPDQSVPARLCIQQSKAGPGMGRGRIVPPYASRPSHTM